MENIIKRNVAAGRKITFGRRKRENYQEQISTQLRERSGSNYWHRVRTSRHQSWAHNNTHG